MKNIKKCFKALVIILPFFLGSAGYLLAGEEISQSMYNALQLYLFEYSEVDHINIFLEISRWVAPLVSISGIFLILKTTAQSIKDWLCSLGGKSIVVYCEGRDQQFMRRNIKNCIIGKKEKVRDGMKNNIIMYDNDLDNLNFYYANKKQFENSRVYMHLQQIDSFLLKKSTINFFNETELVAREYWKKFNLLKYIQNNEVNIKIAVIGFEQLGQKILSFGLMNNIYTPNQRIEYHIWGKNAVYESMLSNMNLMNGDSVIFHEEDWENNYKELENFQRIIVTKENSMELLQALLYLSGESEIHYYNKGEVKLEELFGGEKLCSFGATHKILTKRNIMSEELYRLGMELNLSYQHDYAENYEEIKHNEKEMRALWEELDGFTKGSNIAAADYHEIRLLTYQYLGKGEADLVKEKEWLSEAEHIRWSRYHFLNHWQYAELEGGKNKDAKKRLHKDLIPYNQLSKEEQSKDWDTIQRLIKLKGLDETNLINK